MPSSRHVWMVVFGTALGFVLSRGGFSDYGEIHRMFTLAEPRLILAFAGAVALGGAGFALLCRGHAIPPRPIHRGIVPGSLLFGVGWAVTGACPTSALVQLGEGRAAALLSIVGVLAGVKAAQAFRRRHHWDTGACGG